MGQVNYPKVADSSSFDEDSSDALSPEQPASHESQGSVPSPLEARGSESLPTATSVSPTQVSLPSLDASHAPQGPQTCWSSPGGVAPMGQVGGGSQEAAQELEASAVFLQEDSAWAALPLGSKPPGCFMSTERSVPDSFPTLCHPLFSLPLPRHPGGCSSPSHLHPPFAP